MLNSLNIAQSGLASSQALVENAANNIANENTPGYKKRVGQVNELQQNEASMTGSGVHTTSIDRIVSNYMYSNILTETGKTNYLMQKSNMMGSIESLFKEINTDTTKSGFSFDLNRYFQAVEDLRSDPNSEVYKSAVKEQGEFLVNSMKRLYNGIENQEKLEQASINENIDVINGILKDIGKINEQLGQKIVPPNDLLDKRDRLEQQLSQYVDITVDRTGEDYHLKIGDTTAIRYSTNVREISLQETLTPQKDKYVQEDGYTSNILNGVTFDNQDTITYNFDNTNSVSVSYGEEMTFDLDGDGETETIKVDETNYVRALTHKINHDPVMSLKISAYNGLYTETGSGDRLTENAKDYFLNIESKVDGTIGRFNGHISIKESTPETEVQFTAPSISSISADIKQEGKNLVHKVNIEGDMLNDTQFDFALSDVDTVAGDFNGIPTFTNGVTYNVDTGKINVPAGVKSFEVSVPTKVDESKVTPTDPTELDETYTLTIGTKSTTGTLKDSAAAIVVSDVSSESQTEGSTLTHTVTLSGETTAVQRFSLNLNDQTSSADDFVLGDDSKSLAENLVFDPPSVTYDVATGEVVVPAGVESFSIQRETNSDTNNEADETYSLSIGGKDATGTIVNDDANENIKISSITSDIKNEGGTLTHRIKIDGTIIEPQEFDFSITSKDLTVGDPTIADEYNPIPTFTNGVTYDGTTGKITVPPGVTEFEVKVQTTVDVATTPVEADEKYTLTIGSKNTTGTIQDVSKDPVIGNITSDAQDEGTSLTHTVSLSAPAKIGGQAFDFSVSNLSTEDGDISSHYTFVPDTVTYDKTTKQITVPEGVESFQVSINSINDTLNEMDEVYTLKVGAQETTGTIKNDDHGIAKVVYKNDRISSKAEDSYGLAVYDETIPVSSGSLKAQLENLNTSNGMNKFQSYKDKLDQFAQTLADISNSYIQKDDGSYIYGSAAVDDAGNEDNTVKNLGLFSGSSVSTLSFNALAVNDLDQFDMQYLATIQFKKDISFDGNPQGSLKTEYSDTDTSSFQDFFKELRVGISADKQNNDFLRDTQKAVQQSLQSSYDKVVKVDKDEELINVTKFKAAYDANAKVITMINEMLQTILRMR